MKKRMLSIVLMLVMLVSVVPMPQAGAAASYSVDKAIAYAKQHWNDGQGECAEFVSRCVRAGGLDMKVITTTRSCLNAAAKASGLPIKELKLNSEGHATKADNGSILAAGDIVAQYCKTDDLYPHIMLCGGYDSQGRATFYAHNGAINNKVQVLNVNTAYDHTLACDIRAHVVHLSSLDDGIFTSSDSTSSSSGVTFSLPTDPNYTSKQKITNTNAVLVNKITKPAGTKVTQMGLHVYDFNGSNIGDHWDYVSNVSDSTTTFHCWYDLNSEFHTTLTPGNTYKYYFYGEFDGQKVTGPTFSFTTTGTRPYVNFWLSDTEKVSFPLETGLTYYAHGEFPEPYEREGYTFDGWYTDPVGGTEITRADYYRGTATVNLYPHYTKNAVVEPTPEPEPDPEPPVVEEPVAEEPEEFTLVFMDLRTMESYGTYTVQNGDKYPIPSRTPTRDGYVFDGWYTSSTGGTQVTSSTTVNLTRDQNLYPHWREVPQLLPETTEITLQIGNPYLYINGARKNIDEQGTVPLLRNSRTLLPVRAVVEAMGGTVNWINSSETVVMTLDGKSLNLQIGSRTAWDGSGNTYQLDVAPILVQSRTMLPIRFVVEYFGGEVLWDNPTETVTINYAA